MASRVVVAVGTKKGLFVLEGSTSAKRLELRGPFFPGMPINAAMIDRRSKTPKVLAVPSSPWFGTTIQVSKDLGKKFKATKSAPAFAADDGRTLTVTSTHPARTLVELIKWIDQQGIELEDVHLRRPSLEDVFIELTGKKLRE